MAIRKKLISAEALAPAHGDPLPPNGHHLELAWTVGSIKDGRVLLYSAEECSLKISPCPRDRLWMAEEQGVVNPWCLLRPGDGVLKSARGNPMFFPDPAEAAAHAERLLFLEQRHASGRAATNAKRKLLVR